MIDAPWPALHVPRTAIVRYATIHCLMGWMTSTSRRFFVSAAVVTSCSTLTSPPTTAVTTQERVTVKVSYQGRHCLLAGPISIPGVRMRAHWLALARLERRGHCAPPRKHAAEVTA